MVAEDNRGPAAPRGRNSPAGAADWVVAEEAAAVKTRAASAREREVAAEEA